MTTEPSKINILIMIPQYVILTAGEILTSITLLEFAFSQVSHNTRSLVYKQPKKIMTILCCLKFGQISLVRLLICSLNLLGPKYFGSIIFHSHWRTSNIKEINRLYTELEE